MNLAFRLVKMADMGYITLLHFIAGFSVASLLNKHVEEFNEEKESKKPIIYTVLNIFFYLWISGIVIYILKNLIEHIPSPFDGLYGFHHMRIKELSDAPILAFTILYYQFNLTRKLEYLYKYYKNM